MKTYIGTKIVQAEPMDSHTFSRTVRRLFSPTPMDAVDGYRVLYEDGYTSWSPKESFERAYREVTEAEKKLI